MHRNHHKGLTSLEYMMVLGFMSLLIVSAFQVMHDYFMDPIGAVAEGIAPGSGGQAW